MTAYTLTSGDGITREDGAFIPADSDNRDFAAYLQWVEEGGVPEPCPPEPEPVPDPVAIARAAGIAKLITLGLTEAEAAALAGVAP